MNNAGSREPIGSATSIVVAVDGPSGSGKSTVSRRVAQALGLRYLDTGAMYRALTWWVLRHGIDPLDAAGIGSAANDFPLVIGTDPTAPTVTVAEEDVASAIRGPEITAAVSAVSAIPEVRAALVARQRRLIGSGGIVVEGRDIGTTVAPAAPVKIFLTASPEVRSRRRALEHVGPGSELVGERLSQTLSDLERRDRLDSTRAASPLAMAADALALDTSSMGIDEVVATILKLVEERS